MVPTRAAAAALALLLAVAARAQAPGEPAGGFAPHAYGQVRLGLYAPQSSDMQGFGNGVAAGGALGYRFHPSLGAELEVGYLRSTASASAQGLSVDATFSVIPISLDLKAIAPLGAAEVYALAGVGLHRVTLQASVTGFGSASVTDSAFGFQAGAGLAFPVAPTLSLGADLRYQRAEASFSGTSGVVDGVVVCAALLARF